MRYTLRQLGYFIAAGEHGSIRKASEHINVSQPSISAAVASLEQQLGLTLFIRHHAQGLSLTRAGEAFFHDARQFMKHAEELERTGSRLAEEVSGPLAVQCYYPLAPFVIPGICHQFRDLHDSVTMTITEGDQKQILENLRNGSVDSALSYNLQVESDLDFEALVHLPPYAILSSQHQLATRQSLTLEELSDYPLILLNLPHSRDYFRSMFTQIGITPRLLTTTRQVEVMRCLAGQGKGYGLANVKPINDRTLDGQQLVYIPLSDSVQPLDFGLLRLAESVAAFTPRRALLAFEAFVRAQVSKGMLPGTR